MGQPRSAWARCLLRGKVSTRTTLPRDWIPLASPLGPDITVRSPSIENSASQQQQGQAFTCIIRLTRSTNSLMRWIESGRCLPGEGKTMDFYREAILDPYSHPRYWAVLSPPDIEHAENNPLCVA